MYEHRTARVSIRKNIMRMRDEREIDARMTKGLVEGLCARMLTRDNANVTKFGVFQ